MKEAVAKEKHRLGSFDETAWVTAGPPEASETSNSTPNLCQEPGRPDHKQSRRRFLDRLSRSSKSRKVERSGQAAQGNPVVKTSADGDTQAPEWPDYPLLLRSGQIQRARGILYTLVCSVVCMGLPAQDQDNRTE